MSTIYRWKFGPTTFEQSPNPWRYVDEKPIDQLTDRILEEVSAAMVVAALDQRYEDGLIDGNAVGEERVAQFADRFIAAISTAQQLPADEACSTCRGAGAPLASKAAAPVLYVSPEQLEGHRDAEGEHGTYLPARKTAIGKFTQPLYARAPAAVAAEQAPAGYEPLAVTDLPSFPSMLLQMYSGGRVQEWIDDNIKPLVQERHHAFHCDAPAAPLVRPPSLVGLGKSNVVIRDSDVDERVSMSASGAQEVDARGVDLGINGLEHHPEIAASASPHSESPDAGCDGTAGSAHICTLPPAGWQCTREPGHEGPCAAHPVVDDAPLDSGTA